jgi:CTP:molybdopterin cytidylyltransferase MocA
MMVGVLLAGGASTRMKSPKALAKQGRSSYMAHGIRNLWSACASVVAVLGANGPAIQREVEEEFTRLVESGALHDDLSRAHRKGADGYEVHFSRNPRWKSGMFSSVQVGLRDALDLDPEGVLVLPVDHPSVKTQTIGALAEMLGMALAACPPKERVRFSYAIVPRHRGHRGHPLALSPALARAITKSREATDLGDAVRRHARLVGYLDVADKGILRNVNRPGD